MPLPFDQTGSMSRRYASLIKGIRIPIIIYLVFYIAISAIYFKSLFQLGNLDFPDLGVFPLYPGQILEQNTYYWQLGGFGSVGSILPYSIIIYSFGRIFLNSAIAEKVWILTLLPIASFSIFSIAYYRIKMKLYYSLIFSFLYAFNPVTMGLFYMGSVNDTLTMYIFEPILLALVLCLISSKTYLREIQSSIAFVLLFYYVYSWSPEVVMWILPFFFISLILWIIFNIKNPSQLKIVLFGAFFSIFTVLLITNNISTIFIILTGHGKNTLAISGGTTNVSDLVINFSDNFVGQLSYSYAIFAFFLSGMYILLFLKVKKSLSTELKNLYLSSILFILIILIIWTAFRFSIMSFETMLASYLPEIAAYEPFMGITLLFSLFFIDFIILWNVITNIDNNQLIKHISLTVNSTKRRRRLIIQISAVILITLILLSSSVGYWRREVPSTVNQLVDSNLVFNQYSVPNDYLSMSNWLNEHLFDSEGRYLILPYGGMSNEAISSFIPEIPSVNLPYNTWRMILNDNNSLNFKSFSQELSLMGIEYLVINKGPYVPGDTVSNFKGNIRIIKAGFPWDLSYLPAGSWQNWSKLFKNDQYLLPVLNNDNWLVLQNNLFTGLFHIYLFPHNFDTSDISSITENGNILYYPNKSVISLNFSIPKHNAFSENWTETIGTNGEIFYNGGPLPSNMTYSNIWEMVPLKNTTYYDLNYSISGKNMSNASIIIRFYSGSNMSGNVVTTYSSAPEMGNITNMSYNYNFKTPEEFGSSAIFLSYSSNSHVKFYQYTFHINSLRYENESYLLDKPLINGYQYLNPTKLSINLSLPENSTTILLYSSSFNAAWTLNTQNTTYYSNPLTVIWPLQFTSFVIHGNLSGAIINFKLQESYNFYKVTVFTVIILYGSFLSSTFLISVWRKKNGSR